MKKIMTPRERVLAALRREPHDRVPVGGILWSGLQHDLIDLDYTWEETFHDPDKLFRVVERQHTEYGYDYFGIPIDMRIEGEAFGSQVGYNLSTGRGMRLGMVTKWIVEREKDLTSLKVYEPKKVSRMAMILEVVTRLREKYPDVAIFGYVNGIANTHTDVVNDTEKFPKDPHGHFRTLFENITSNPKFVHRTNEILLEGAISWGKALIKAGCDGITTLESMSFLGLAPDQYVEFVTQYHSRLLKVLGVPYIIHECDIGKVIKEIVTMGPTACIISSPIELKWAFENYGDKLCFIGNLGTHNPGDILCSGNRDMAKKAARACIEVAKTVNGFILGGGCEVHFGVPRENIKVMSEAVKEYGQLMPH